MSPTSGELCWLTGVRSDTCSPSHALSGTSLALSVLKPRTSPDRFGQEKPVRHAFPLA